MKQIITFIIVTLIALMPMSIDAQLKTRKIDKYSRIEDGMSFYWKKKKGKYALVVKQTGYEDFVLTDYVYSVSKATSKNNIHIYHSSLGIKRLRDYFVTVERDGKFGVLNLIGEEVVPCVYNGMYDSQGEIINNSKYKYNAFDNVGNTAATTMLYYVTDENNKWGQVYDEKSIIEPVFDKIYPENTKYHLVIPDITMLCYDFYRDMMSVGFWNIPLKTTYDDSDMARFEPIVEKDGKFGIIDGGKIIVPPIFDKESFQFSSNDIVQNQSGYYTIRGGLISQTSLRGSTEGGQPVFQTISIKNKLYLLQKDGEKVWYDIRNGNTIKIGNVKSELISKTERNIYYQYNNGVGYGYVTEDGFEIPALYGEEIENFFPIPADTAEIFKVKNVKNDKLIGLYNAKLKKEILPPEYSKIVKTELKDGFFLLQKDSITSYYAYIPPKGDSVILLNDKKDAYKNAELIPIDNTLSMVKKDGAYGMIDSESGLMIPCIYDSIKPIENVRKNIPDCLKSLWVSYLKGKIGLITKDAVIVYPYCDKRKLEIHNNDKLRLYSSDTEATEVLLIAVENDEFKIEYNWDELLNKILNDKYYDWSGNKYSDVAYLALYTDNQPLLKSATFAHIKRFEDDLWSMAADGESFAKQFNKLIGLCYYSFMQLGIDELEEYINKLNDMAKNLTAIREEKVKELQQQEAERQRQLEEQQRQLEEQQRIAAEQARLERQQQWEESMAILATLADYTNTIINSSKARKRAKTHSHNHKPKSTSHNHKSTSSSSSSGMVTCNHCNGTGSCGFTKDWNLNKRSCHGTGKCLECIDGIVTDAFGSRVCSYCKGTAKCPICNGSGKCTKCHGTGKMKK